MSRGVTRRLSDVILIAFFMFVLFTRAGASEWYSIGAFDVAPGSGLLLALDTSNSPVDTDGDAVLDEFDNCVLVANASQLDSDDDGYGNRCDADLDNSGGLVDLIDFVRFRVVYGTVNVAADFNGSGGQVNEVDYSIFKQLLNKVPGPSGLVR